MKQYQSQLRDLRGKLKDAVDDITKLQKEVSLDMGAGRGGTP